MSIEFGNRLKKDRLNAGLKTHGDIISALQEIGNKTITDRSVLSRYENGTRDPDSESAAALMRVTNQPPEKKAEFLLSAAGHNDEEIANLLATPLKSHNFEPETPEDTDITASDLLQVFRAVDTRELSQAEIARNASVDHGQLSKLLSGEKRRAGPEIARRLAEVVAPPDYRAELCLMLEGHEYSLIQEVLGNHPNYQSETNMSYPVLTQNSNIYHQAALE